MRTARKEKKDIEANPPQAGQGQSRIFREFFFYKLGRIIERLRGEKNIERIIMQNKRIRHSISRSLYKIPFLISVNRHRYRLLYYVPFKYYQFSLQYPPLSREVLYLDSF